MRLPYCNRPRLAPFKATTPTLAAASTGAEYGCHTSPRATASTYSSENCGYYAFDAINRRIVASDKRSREVDYAPYTDGGVSDTFVVYPLQLPNTPIPTAINEINLPSKQTDNCWFTIDGRNLGTTKPTTPGLYINGNQKIIITPLH